jgi:methyl-galactoside transport system substrate-binding protein
MTMKRRFPCIWLCLFLLAPIFPPAVAQFQLPVLGVFIYNGEDTFMSSLLDVIRAEADGIADLIVYDAENNQNLQNDQVESQLKAGVDALIVNPVDRTTAIYLLQMAMNYQKPIVFINREPLLDDLQTYDKAYYVGIDPKEQGILQGKLAAEFFKTHASADKSGDGVMQFVIIKGEPGHQDAELRTLYTLKSLQTEGIVYDKLQEEPALWERSLGQERMAAMLNAHGDRIECVISNNDDMALGAIEALKAAGYFTGGRFIPVIGIDATAPAVEALEQGSLYATVINNAFGQGHACVLLAILLAREDEITPDNFPYEINDKIIYIESTSLVTEQRLWEANET